MMVGVARTKDKRRVNESCRRRVTSSVSEPSIPDGAVFPTRYPSRLTGYSFPLNDSRHVALAPYGR